MGRQPQCIAVKTIDHNLKSGFPGTEFLHDPRFEGLIDTMLAAELGSWLGRCVLLIVKLEVIYRTGQSYMHLG